MSKEKSPQIQSYAISALGGLAWQAFARSRKEKQRRLEMEKLAMRDSLTGLSTRRALETTYASLQNTYQLNRNRSYEDGREKSVKHSLLLIDVDHFKKINDTLGHARGDDVLKSVASRIITRSRQRDIPARLETDGSENTGRWGGEEIAWLLPRAGKKDAVKVAEEIRGLIEADGDVTVSIGVVRLDLNESLETNVERADLALYHAKENGRNQVVAYSPKLGSAPKPTNVS